MANKVRKTWASDE